MFKSLAALAFAGLLSFTSVVKAADPYTLANRTYTLNQGYYFNRPILFYTFYLKSYPTNVTTPPTVAPTAPIFVFLNNVTDTPDKKVQPNIIDVIPGDDNYSDLWQLIKVVGKPAGTPDIKSLTDLNAMVANKTITLFPQDVYVNCPVVGYDAQLANSSDAVVVHGYYKGQLVKYFDFGPNPSGNATQPIYHVNTNHGVQTLVDSIPSTKNYSAFWNVENYTPAAANMGDNFTTVDQIASLKPTWANVVANCPIAHLDAVAPSSGSTPSTPAKTSSAMEAFTPLQRLPVLLVSLASITVAALLL